MELDKENENKIIGNKVEYSREEDDATRAAQLQKSENLTPNTNITNVSKFNSSTSANRNNNNNGKEKCVGIQTAVHY